MGVTEGSRWSAGGGTNEEREVGDGRDTLSLAKPCTPCFFHRSPRRCCNQRPPHSPTSPAPPQVSKRGRTALLRFGGRKARTNRPANVQEGQWEHMRVQPVLMDRVQEMAAGTLSREEFPWVAVPVAQARAAGRASGAPLQVQSARVNRGPHSVGWARRARELEAQGGDAASQVSHPRSAGWMRVTKLVAPELSLRKRCAAARTVSQRCLFMRRAEQLQATRAAFGGVHGGGDDARRDARGARFVGAAGARHPHWIHERRLPG